MQRCDRQPVLIYACLCSHRGEEINMQTSLSNVGKSFPSSMMHRRTHHILVLGFVMEKISMAASPVFSLAVHFGEGRDGSS